MIQKTTLQGLPEKRAADYRLEEFSPPRYARVIYLPVTAIEGAQIIEAQAFEVDASGVFCTSPTGAPSRTSGTQHTIDLSGVGDTSTLRPGWIRIVGNYSDRPVEERTLSQQPLPEGTLTVTSKPKSGAPGDYIWLTGTLYRWDDGELERIMRGKAESLAGLIRNSLHVAEFSL